MRAETYTINVSGTDLFDETDAPVVGFVVREAGHRSTQSAFITINNQPPGQFWSTTFPSRAPVVITVDGNNEFDGYVDALSVDDGPHAPIVVECAGRTMRLRDSEVRPKVYDDDLASDKRDAAAVTATVSGGQIQLTDYPIDSITKVTASGSAIFVLNADLDNGIIYVDPFYNGQTVKVSYTAFKSKYSAVAASDIVLDLVSRYGASQGITSSNVSAIATTLTYEPPRDGNLFDVLGQIRDFLGGGYDFYLDTNNDLHFFQRTGSSVATINDTDVDLQKAKFSVDYSAYANKVTVRSSSAVTNSIAPSIGPFPNDIDQGTTTTPATGTKVSQVGQGFKALDSSLQSFQLQAKRQGESDAIDWSVQYNGKTAAVLEDFTASHSLTPDSTNIAIDAANDRIHVKANGSGTAYFSGRWAEDLDQSQSNTTTNVGTATNVYQTVRVSDLTRKTVKGIAFKTASTANNVTVKIYSGTNGNTGTLLGTSEAVPLGANDHEQETDWFAVYFNDSVDVSAQTDISIVPNTDAGTFAWARQSTDVYGNGDAKDGAATLGGDFTFQFFTTVSDKDLLAAVLRWTFTATLDSTTPTIYIARDYQIGSPAAANWQAVINSSPALFTKTTGTSSRFGIKVAFTGSSTTTDPLLSKMQGDVAYLDATTALDQPSGITVGGLSGTIASDDLPYFNQNLGSLTKDITTDQSTQLAVGGYYWLALYDGNATNDPLGASYFTVLYDDGASATYLEDWDDTSKVGSSSNLTVDDSEASITRNKKVASFISSDLFTTTNAITAARIQATESLRSGGVVRMVARNKRNYYNPERSTDTSKPAANTGEICCIQFDDGDGARIASSNYYLFKDQSGNGFDGGFVNTGTFWVTGKYGKGIEIGHASAYGTPGITNLARWLTGDFSIGFWFKPNAALAAANLCYIGRPASSVPIQFQIKTTSAAHPNGAGQLQVIYTYSQGGSTRTFTTDNTASATVLVNGTDIHIGVIRSGTSISVYFNGILKNTFTQTENPDISLGGTTIADVVFNDNSPSGIGAFQQGILDDLRIWPRAIETWLLWHVSQYPYANTGAKFTYPTEADHTNGTVDANADDYTDTGTAADGVKKNLRVVEFFCPAAFQEDGVILRAQMGNACVAAGTITASLFDLSSYAHSASFPATPTVVASAASDSQFDFNGTTQCVKVTNDDYLHFGQTWALMGYFTQDTTGNQQTILHKRGEVKVRATATSATLTDLVVDLTCVGGIARSKTFTGLSWGTAQTHVAVTYDGQVLKVFIAGTEAASNDFGTVLAVANSTNDLHIACANDSGSTRSNFWDGKMDEFIWLNYTATATDIQAIDNDPSVGLRSPTQQDYTAAAYDGTGTKAYTDGKYLVCRDGATAKTWVDTLDGTNSNGNGTLGFVMTFGKDNVQAIARDETEIARAGMEVGKVFEVAATDLATLQSIASGYLAMLKNGISRGTIEVDYRSGLSVGDILTINYSDKGQSAAQYAIASKELTVGEGMANLSLGLGEDERSAANLFGKAEVGILG